MSKINYPEKCYVYIQTTNTIGIVYPYESGYYKTEVKPNSYKTAQAEVDKLNETIGVDKVTADCMMTGSMFGWDIPGANPEYMRRQLAKIAKEKENAG